MSSDLIIDVTPSEIVIALLEDNKLAEFTKDKSGAKYAVGDIYIGKVKKVMPSLNAAFVDVGYEKDAFLHYLDLGPQFATLNKFLRIALSNKSKFSSISRFQSESDINKEGNIADLLKVGQKILVQVTKEPISSKGPRLTSEISIAGRNLVLMPFGDKVSVSQKIKSGDEKNRLKNLIQGIKPRNYGVIVRTVAQGKNVSEFDAELRQLVSKFEMLISRISKSNSPMLVMSEMDRTIAMLRDIYNPNFNSIMVNDKDVAIEISEYLGSINADKKKIVKHYKGRLPIFEHYGIDKQLKASFGKTISFKEGAYLIIEHTEAFHVIDVNSGNRLKTDLDQEANALDINLSACEEIARQLRLRDMGGIIVIDFIDMHQAVNRQKVFDHMKNVMEFDRSKHNILPLSKFCLMQITRQRVRPEMNIETAELCPSCKGSGSIAPSVLFAEELDRKITYLLKELNRKKLKLKVHPYLAAFLTKGFNSLRWKWLKKHIKWVSVIPDFTYGFLEYRIFDENNEEIII